MRQDVQDQFKKIQESGVLTSRQNALLGFLLEYDHPLSAAEIIDPDTKNKGGKKPFGNVDKSAIGQNMGRMRTRLKNYYETSPDPIRFEIPVGKYFVEIIFRTEEDISCAVAKARQISVNKETPQTNRFRSNILARGYLPFVGREALLEEIKNELGELSRERVVVLSGQAAVGKTELAREYARLHRDSYIGGTFFIDASNDAIAIELARVGKNILNLPFPAHLPVDDQGQQTFFSLGSAPTLLIYDNVNAYKSLAAWVPPHGMSCHVLVTTIFESNDPAWSCINISPLKRAESLEIVKQLAGAEVASLYGNAIVDHADGLPLEIIHHSKNAAYEYKRCREYVCSGIGPDTIKSFSAAYQRLHPRARLLLHAAAFFNPQRIPQKELSHALRKGLGWSASQLDKALDACLDIHALEGTADLRIHQLDASFINESELSPDDKLAVEKTRSVQFSRFVELAGLIVEDPANTDIVGTLMSYPLGLTKWGKTVESDYAQVSLKTIGKALFETGRFLEARVWFERAVTVAKEQRDEQGQGNHQLLGTTLHCVGECLQAIGAEEAILWFLRAVEAKEKGDMEECIDHTSLAKSLLYVCLETAKTGNSADARLLCNRALEAAEKGKSAASRDCEQMVSSSLAIMAGCLLNEGKFEESVLWLEKALKEVEQVRALGSCLVGECRFDEARALFGQEVAAAEREEELGRVDHNRLSLSLHYIGVCLIREERRQDARPFLERAVKEAKKGDADGRIDYDSLHRSMVELSKCWAVESDALFWDE